MPKDEFDPDDPMELCGVGIVTEEDTTSAMAECFIEEFMRLRYNHKQILALFRNPHYTGMNMVLQNKGEAFVRTCIAETFAKRGKTVKWPSAAVQPLPIDQCAPSPHPSPPMRESVPEGRVRGWLGDSVCSEVDPTGAPAPDINL